MPMDEYTATEWQVILGPGPRLEVEAAWDAWLAEHDISDLAHDAIRLDTGRAANGKDFRRCMIRKEALQRINPPIEPDEEA